MLCPAHGTESFSVKAETGSAILLWFFVHHQPLLVAVSSVRLSCAIQRSSAPHPTSRLSCKDRLHHALVTPPTRMEPGSAARHGCLPTCTPALPHQAGTGDGVSLHMGSAQDRCTLQSGAETCSGMC